MARDSVSMDTVEDTVNLSPNESNGGAGGFHITGTWVGTITFEAKAPEAGSSDWVAIPATNMNDDTTSTTTTANGIFRIIADGLHIRARFSADTSGTVVVYPYEVTL